MSNPYSLMDKKLGKTGLGCKLIHHPKTPSCKNCKYARKAYNENYVGCVAAYPEVENKDNYNKFLVNFYQRIDLAFGWVYLRCAPDKKEDSFGLCATGIPVFKPDDYCDHYKFKGED